MYYLRKTALFLIAQILFMGLAFAQTHGTAAEAKALAEKAVAYVKSAGAEKAFEEFSNRDPKWVDKDLYVFAVKTDGTVLAPCVRLVVASIGSETGGNHEVRKWQDTDK